MSVCLSPFRPDSSGFEHVFVGETRGGRTVIGFHNWIQLYLQEKLGHIDYKGYSVNANSPQVQCYCVSLVLTKMDQWGQEYIFSTTLSVLYFPVTYSYQYIWQIFNLSSCLFSLPLLPKCWAALFAVLLSPLALITVLAHWWETSHPSMTTFALSPSAQLSVFCLSNLSLMQITEHYSFSI